MLFFKPLYTLVTFVMLAGVASAQVPLQCNANAGVPPIARAEGVAEEVGQVVIVCTGGTPTPSPTQDIPTINVQVFLNTNITSRLLDSTSARSEALLLIDEPVGVEQVEAHSVPNTDAVKASGDGSYKTPGVAGRPTVFGAQQASPNSLVWLNVPFDPPGNGGSRVLRLVNIRANANQLGVGNSLIPNEISMVISITGAASFALNNQQFTVAFIPPGMKFSATSATYNQCDPGTRSVTLTFAEQFGTAFRHRRFGGDQNVPGSIYNTESMFYSSAFTGIGAGAGLASHGSRLSARFSNVPANVTITVPVNITSDQYSTASPPVLVSSNDGAALVALGTDGSTANESTGAVGLSGGAGVAVWEVNRSNPGAISSLRAVISVSYGVTPPPGLDQLRVAGSYSPVASTLIASSEVAPRFLDTPQSVFPFTLAGCTSPGTFYLNQKTVTFIGTADGSIITPAQEVTVFTGSGVGAWSASSDSAWLGISPGSGQNNDKFSVVIVPAGYPSPGTYSGKITVNASGATPSQVYVSCTLVVTTASSGPIEPGITRVFGDGQLRRVWDGFADPLVIRIVSASGNPVVEKLVTWTVEGEVQIYTPSVTITDANGMAQVSVIPSGAFTPSGSFSQATITASTDIGNTVFHLTQFPASGIDPSPQIEMIAPAQQDRTVTVKLGTKHYNAIGVRVLSGGGLPIPNVALNISAEPNAGIGATCEGGTPPTNASGYAWCNLSARGRVGLYPLNVNVGSHTNFPGVQVNVTAGDPVAPVIQQGNGQSGVPGATLPSSLVVRLNDDYGNPLPATPVSWTVVPAGAATLVNAATQADSNGYASAQVQLGNAPGSFQVKVTAGGKESIFTLAVQAVTPVTLSLNRTALNFAATATGASITQPQDVYVGMVGGNNIWTATSNSAWLAVTPAAGQGSGRFSVSILRSALPASGSYTYTGKITLNSLGATNGPLVVNCTLTGKSSSSVPFGSFDSPVDGAKGIAGSIAVTGWALDDIGISKVSIWRDPVGPEPVHPNGYIYIGDAMFVAGTRPDVEARYSSFPNSNRGGWGYLMLTYGLPNANGTFRLHTVATNEEGRQFELGSKTITVDNAHSVKPFGAIDSPAPGQTISGIIANDGWALTPKPASIATDGSTMWVNIDGVDVGHPSYGIGRGDVAALFAGYANSTGAGGSYSLDTSKYTNAMHAISWNVYDGLGHGDGVGSRYFTIQNSGAAATMAPIEREFQLRSARLRRPAAAVASYPAFRRGFDRNAVLAPIRQAGEGLLEPIELKELDRVEIHLAGGQRWTAALRVGGELRELPVGSTFDDDGGIFYWQPGPAFLGEYSIEFRAEDGTILLVPVQVGGVTRDR